MQLEIVIKKENNNIAVYFSSKTTLFHLGKGAGKIKTPNWTTFCHV
jgi:hypothetical protein